MTDGTGSVWASLSATESSIQIAKDALDALTSLVVAGQLYDDDGRLRDDAFSTFMLGAITELSRAESSLHEAMRAVRG